MTRRSRTPHRRSALAPTGACARGFTLIEVLVAVGIFALIGIAAAGLLGRTLDTRTLTQERSDRMLALQRAVARFERDALQFADRPIRDEFGDYRAALVLEDGTLELTSRGRANPLGLPRSALERIHWSLDEEGTLRRRLWPVLDRAQDTRFREQVVLENVRSLEFELIAADGAVHVEWPIEALASRPEPGEQSTVGPEGTPRALRMALDVEPWGRIERLLRLPEAVSVGDEGNDPTRNQDTPGATGAPQTEQAQGADGSTDV